MNSYRKNLTTGIVVISIIVLGIGCLLYFFCKPWGDKIIQSVMLLLGVVLLGLGIQFWRKTKLFYIGLGYIFLSIGFSLITLSHLIPKHSRFLSNIGDVFFLIFCILILGVGNFLDRKKHPENVKKWEDCAYGGYRSSFRESLRWKYLDIFEYPRESKKCFYCKYTQVGMGRVCGLDDKPKELSDGCERFERK
ncbi:MAG: hypothetical protein PHE49_11510 [bacterium]|nr:hypothetical protein [bacterium]